MQTFELQRSITRFFSDFDEFQPFTAALSALANSAEAMEKFLPGIAEGGEKLNQSVGALHTYFAHVHRITSSNNHRQFYRALEHFQRSISQLQPSTSPRTTLITQLNTEVEAFAALYDAFLSSPTGPNALPLILAAQHLQTKLQIMLSALQLFEESVGSYDVPSSSEAQLALWLPAHLDLADFARRLLALQSIYSEMCMLLSVSEGDHPLRISKIESGSLWAKVFGESRVVGMMASFIEQSALWMYRTYTNEGKLASIPRKVETIDSLIGLTKRLKEAGLETSAMQSHIEKSAVSLSKDLQVLLDGQASVTVNEQTISIGSEITKIFLDRTAPLQLLNTDPKGRDEPPEIPTPQ